MAVYVPSNNMRANEATHVFHVSIMDVVLSMKMRRPLRIFCVADHGPRLIEGIVSMIQAEDGSGLSWNLGISTREGTHETVYWHEVRHAIFVDTTRVAGAAL